MIEDTILNKKLGKHFLSVICLVLFIFSLKEARICKNLLHIKLKRTLTGKSSNCLKLGGTENIENTIYFKQTNWMLKKWTLNTPWSTWYWLGFIEEGRSGQMPVGLPPPSGGGGACHIRLVRLEAGGWHAPSALHVKKQGEWTSGMKIPGGVIRFRN